MRELCIFFGWVVNLVAVTVDVFDVSQVEDQWAPGHDSWSTRQEVTPNDALKHGALTGRLGPDNYNLRQFNIVAYLNHGESLLKLNDEGHQRVYAFHVVMNRTRPLELFKGAAAFIVLRWVSWDLRVLRRVYLKSFDHISYYFTYWKKNIIFY